MKLALFDQTFFQSKVMILNTNSFVQQKAIKYLEIRVFFTCTHLSVIIFVIDIVFRFFSLVYRLHMLRDIMPPMYYMLTIRCTKNGWHKVHETHAFRFVVRGTRKPHCSIFKHKQSVRFSKFFRMGYDLW